MVEILSFEVDPCIAEFKDDFLEAVEVRIMSEPAVSYFPENKIYPDKFIIGTEIGRAHV